jgi:GNAT superfamily N-acetyltransferase
MPQFSSEAAYGATRLRLATLADLEAIIANVSGHFDDTPFAVIGGTMDFPHAFDLARKAITQDISDSIVIVADHDGELVGIIAAIDVSPHYAFNGQTVAGECFWWVHKDLRGSSLGIKLLRHFEDWGSKMHFDYLQVGAVDTRTGKLLERLGYTEVSRTYMKKIA